MYDFPPHVDLPALFCLNHPEKLTQKAIGYLPRRPHSRIRLPVYLRDETKSEFSKRSVPAAVMVVMPDLTAQHAPGMALLLPEQNEVHYFASMDRWDMRFGEILEYALNRAQQYQLLTWDAQKWREGLLAFPNHSAMEHLRALPVYCLRLTLEETGLDATSLEEACHCVGLTAPAYNPLAHVYSAQQLWHRLKSWPAEDVGP